MSTNVVTFPARRIDPHVTRGHDPDVRLASASPPDSIEVSAAIEDIDGGPAIVDRIADRLTAFRARLAQLTFYVTDPESWR
jgi:hypothetical protein